MDELLSNYCKNCGQEINININGVEINPHVCFSNKTQKREVSPIPISVDLNMSLFDYCKKISDARQKQKENFKSSKPFSSNYEFVGVLGEVIYGYLTNETADGTLKVMGDDGFDFEKKVQVKSSETFKAKHLIEYTDKDFSKFDYYVFVVVDLKAKNGKIVGWISTKDFLQKAKKTNFGYGERYAILLTELNKWNKNSFYNKQN